MTPKINSNFKYGFTLAEVLITLIIIGVIAAFTIPTLINNTKKQEYVAGLKKAYSLLSNATNAVMYEEGNPRCDIGGWACGNTRVATLLKKHLSVSRDCGRAWNYECFEQGRFKTLAGGLANNNWSMFGSSPYKMVLNNGMQLVIGDSRSDCTYGIWGQTGIENMCIMMIMDINGSKGPNTLGRDIFYFAIKEYGLVPAGHDVESSCSSSSSYGGSCANRVLRENAMNY